MPFLISAEPLRITGEHGVDIKRFAVGGHVERQGARRQRDQVGEQVISRSVFASIGTSITPSRAWIGGVTTS